MGFPSLMKRKKYSERKYCSRENNGALQIGFAQRDIWEPENISAQMVRKYRLRDLLSIRALKEKGSIQSSEIGIIKEDGSVIWTDVTATYLPFSDGQVVIVTRDITESKKAAEELQKAEEKYRIIAEQTGQLVYDYNVEENITELGRQYKRNYWI